MQIVFGGKIKDYGGRRGAGFEKIHSELTVTLKGCM